MVWNQGHGPERDGLDAMNKRDLSERDICTKFITPALLGAGWDNHAQIREEVSFTKGRIIVRGKLVTRGKAKRADYVLFYKPNIPLAIIEAKDNSHPVGGGMQQALKYAEALDIPFVFSSNGDGFAFHDRTGRSAPVESELALNAFPSPQRLWTEYEAWKGLTPEQEQTVLQDYFEDGSGKEPRYYQRVAINRTVEAIAKGQDRILLVMATGTGKTYTAFQIIWRLWKAGRMKRVLFQADRNVLVNQTMRQDVGVDGDAQRISQLCWMFFLKILDDQDQELETIENGYRSPVPKKLQWRAWAADPEGITGDELLDFVNGELFPSLKELPAGQDGRRRVVRDVFEDAYNYMKSGQLMRQVINKIQTVDFNNLKERQHFGDIYEQILNDLQSAGNAGEYYTPRAVTSFMTGRIDPKPGEILYDPACGTGGFLTAAIDHMKDKKYVRTTSDEGKMFGALRATEKKQLPHMLCVTNMLLHGVSDPSFVRHDNTLARPYTSYSQSDRVDIVLTNPPFGGREEDGIEENFPKRSWGGSK